MEPGGPRELVCKLPIPLGITVAYHEAGHAVAHWLKGEPFHHVSIAWQPGSLGHVGKSEAVDTSPLRRKRPWEPLPGRCRPREWDDEVRDREDRIVSSQVAGAAAESILTGRRVHPEGNDRQTACEIALLAGGDWRGARQYLLAMAHETEKLLRAEWWRVQRVASELLKRNYLTFEQVDRLCRNLAIDRNRGDVDVHSSNPKLALQGLRLAQAAATGREADQIDLPGARQPAAAAAFQRALASEPTLAGAIESK